MLFNRQTKRMKTPTKPPRPRRESHAKMMLGLAKTELARLTSSTSQAHEITIAAQEVERWNKRTPETSPLTSEE